MPDSVFIVINKGVTAYEAWTTEEAAHASIEGEESTYDVYKLPLKGERGETPMPEPKGNGWMTVTAELTAEFNLASNVTKAYVIRDMTGEIIDVIDVTTL